MKNTTRAAAVAAAAALAFSGATGVANAQGSGDSAEGSLPSGVSPGSVMDWIGNNTPLGGLVTAITGSAGQAAGSGGDLAGGSGNLNPLDGSSELPSSVGALPSLSSDPLGGSSELPGLSSDPLGGSAAFPSSVGFEPLGGSSTFTSSELAPLVGSQEMAPLSTDLLGGSATFTSSDLAPLTGSAGMGSLGMQPLSTELNLLGGSAALPPLSANFPDGSTEGIGGSAEDVGAGISGSLTNGSAGDITGPLGGSIDSGGSLEPIVGSIATGGILPAISGSIGNTSGSLSDPDTGLLGSVTGNGGSTGGSADVLTGSFGELTEVNGSLTAFTGSLENGSLRSTASTNVGSTVGQDSSLETVASVETSVGGGLLPILSIGGAAALGGAAVGAAAGANVQLPPLPGFPLCDLPQAQIDQLAGAGSVDAQNCPDPQN